MNKRGFTLVELLVVISIIALLLSILMPSLSKARDAAQVTICGTNNKQIGIMFEMYLQENQNRMPPYYTYYRAEADRQYWPSLLAAFDSKWKRGEVPPKYFFCPKQRFKKVWDRNVSYGYNYQNFSGSWISSRPYYTHVPILRTQIKNPASKLVLCESREYDQASGKYWDEYGCAFIIPPNDSGIKGRRSESDKNMAVRHVTGRSSENGRVAVLWADLHSTLETRKIVLDKPEIWTMP